MRKILIGTSGYNYNHWRNIFYPPELSTKEFLNYYQKFFSTVEINYTFYHFPKESTIKKWFEISADNFLYSAKVPRLITHLKKLSNCNEELKRFLDTISKLDKKLGILLFQMPPSFKFSQENIEKILSIKEQIRNFNFTFEFRHQSWFENEISILTENKLSIATVSAPRLKFKIFDSSSHIYIRLHGKNAWYSYDYTEEELHEIAKLIFPLLEKEKTIWIYFNNDFGGFAVKNAMRLKEILGNP